MQDKVCRQYVKPFNTGVKARTFQKGRRKSKRDKRVYYREKLKKKEILSCWSENKQTSIYNKLLTPFLQTGNRKLESQKDKNNGF